LESKLCVAAEDMNEDGTASIHMTSEMQPTTQRWQKHDPYFRTTKLTANHIWRSSISRCRSSVFPLLRLFWFLSFLLNFSVFVLDYVPRVGGLLQHLVAQWNFCLEGAGSNIACSIGYSDKIYWFPLSLPAGNTTSVQKKEQIFIPHVLFLPFLKSLTE